MEGLPVEILRKIGVYLMPEPLTIHMRLAGKRLDFDVCAESMESDSPNDILLAKKRYVKDLHSFGKTCWAAQNTKDFIFREQLTVCFFDMPTITCVLETQNLQPFRSVVVGFKKVNESILPRLGQLSKFSELARLQVRFLVPHTMDPPRLLKFKEQIKQQLLSLAIELDIKLTVHPKKRQFWQTFRTEHWFNHKCQEYYSPGKVQMWVQGTGPSVPPSTEDVLAMIAPQARLSRSRDTI